MSRQLIDLTKEKIYRDFKVSKSIASGYDVPSDWFNIIDNGYSFSLIQGGIEIYNLSNLVVSDIDSESLKIVYDLPETVSIGIYDYVVRNNNTELEGAFFYLTGKLIVVE